jgi:polyhydroxybutyrate depolymerase
MRAARALALGLILAAAALPARAAADDLLALPGGTYRAEAPAGWDGKSALPLVLYLHGYGQSSAEVMADRALVAAVTGAGALLVVPDGMAHAWSFTGAPGHARDDIAFLRAVVADAERRWPVDPGHVVAAGFSIGGSMVWELACHAPQGFTAFLPVSGAFWLPYPEHCEGGPITLRHVHGLSDATVPMAGRVIRGTFRQGDVRRGFDILRRTDACSAAPDRRTEIAGLACEIWSSCAGGRELQLCLHSGDHEIRPEWLRSGLDWALHLTP